MTKTQRHSSGERTIRGERGFTLLELVVVMGIFAIVMLITTSAFNLIVKQMSQQGKSTETDIASIVGLEVLRSDLQNAGYGLPWALQSALTGSKYTEITTSDAGMPLSATFWPSGKSPLTFNDAAGVPRAVQSDNTTFNLDSSGVGSKYLVVKSLDVAPGATQKKWVTVSYGDTGRNPLTTYGSDRDLVASDHVIVLRNTFIDGIPSRQLQVNGGVFSATFDHYTTLTQPHSSGDVFQVYGVDPTTDPRMPFNRADYYVNTPANKPPACAQNTGILYKAIANQGSGYTEVPLLDCVADMQVVYGAGPVGSDVCNSYTATVPGSGSAQDIRQQLKEIRVYILAHEGKKDPSFTYPSKTVPVGMDLGGGIIIGRNFDLEALIKGDWRNYRWKVYTIVVRPKNLIQ
jgi:prepilin-type N-terminal cleavage/methylation domain-containing protein